MTTNTKFLDPEQVLFRVGIQRGSTVVDLGVGSGYYAQASAKLAGVSGKVFVVDVLDEALDHVASEARLNNHKNITSIRADLESGSVEQIAPGCADLVIISNILHEVNNKNNLFTEAYRILKTGGKLLVVEWNDKVSPFGPRPELRVGQDAVRQFANKSNFKFNNAVETDNYHFGLIFIK